jgi:hypothetical protein
MARPWLGMQMQLQSEGPQFQLKVYPGSVITVKSNITFLLGWGTLMTFVSFIKQSKKKEGGL